MDFCDLIKTRRTIRLFKQQPISRNVLWDLIDVARTAPSAANKQPLEYIIVDDREVVEKIFPQLAWAAAVKPKRTPHASAQPVAYIVVLINEKIALPDYGKVDAAAAIENILLAAHSKSIGTCWLGSVNRDNVRQILSIEENMTIDSVIALGYAAEKPIAEDANAGDVTYYLDNNNTLHIPKRPLNEIIHANGY